MIVIVVICIQHLYTDDSHPPQIYIKYSIERPIAQAKLHSPKCPFEQANDSSLTVVNGDQRP